MAKKAKSIPVNNFGGDAGSGVVIEKLSFTYLTGRAYIVMICTFFSFNVAFGQGSIKFIGDYAYGKSSIPTSLRDFKLVDSVLKLPDSIQIIKFKIGGDYGLQQSYERFYYSKHRWLYDSNSPVQLPVNEKLDAIFPMLNHISDNHNEIYLRVKNINNTFKETFIYSIVYNGTVVKSLTSSNRFIDIPPDILDDDGIFSVFNENKEKID